MFGRVMKKPSRQTSVQVLWRRLDVPGHDACRISLDDGRWKIGGTAVWREASAVSRMDYYVQCDELWRTERAVVKGWTGDKALSLSVNRSRDGRWAINFQPAHHLNGLIDIDLGFTPSTNTVAIRRMGLAVGEASPAAAAWIDTMDWELKKIEQSYKRLTETTFSYRAPDHGYHETLTVDPFGLVLDYPGLWTAER